MTRQARIPVLVRLVRKVDRVHGDLPENNPDLGICWMWMGGTTTKGHGRIRDDGTPSRLAYTHRVALAAALGRPLRPGMVACHRCNTPRCCRPSHLYEGTLSDNEQDRWFKIRPVRGDIIIGVDAVFDVAS